MYSRQTALTNIKLMTEETNEPLINLMISKAEESIANYCNLDFIPYQIQGVVEDLAVFKLQNIGKENLKAEKSDDYESTMITDIPNPIKSQLAQFRRPRKIL